MGAFPNAVLRIIDLLAEKRDYFALYEQASLEMLSCESDGLEEKLERRAVIIDRIDSLDAQIDEACDNQPLYCRAARAVCGRGELPEEWKPVFDCAMQIRAIAGRLPDIDPVSYTHLAQLRERVQNGAYYIPTDRLTGVLMQRWFGL